MYLIAARPEALDEGGLVRVRGAEDAVAGDEDRPAILAAAVMHGTFAAVKVWQAATSSLQVVGTVTLFAANSSCVEVQAAEADATEIDLVDLAVVGARVADGRRVIEGDERLGGEVQQAAGVGQASARWAA